MHFGASILSTFNISSNRVKFTDQILHYSFLWQIMSWCIEQNSSPAESWLIDNHCIVYQPLPTQHSSIYTSMYSSEINIAEFIYLIYLSEMTAKGHYQSPTSYTTIQKLSNMNIHEKDKTDKCYHKQNMHTILNNYFPLLSEHSFA